MRIENEESETSEDGDLSDVESVAFHLKKKSLDDIRLFLQHTAKRVLHEDVNLHNSDLYSFLDGMNNYLEAHPERFTDEMGPWDFLFESLAGGLDYE